MLIGLFFDFFGYILIMLPYIFFWDYTDEKHREVMRVLQERADALTNKETSESSGTDAVPAAEAAEAPQ